LALSPLSAAAEPQTPEAVIPFCPGERLSYVLKWGVIPVGTAVFEVLDGTADMGTPAYWFRLTIKSYPVVDLVYKVRDCAESYTDSTVSHALYYKQKQREGRHSRDVAVKFDWDHSTAHYFNKGKQEHSLTLLPGTFDPLSIFYAFRLHPLKDALEVEQPVTDGKKLVLGRAQVIRREKVKVEAGEFDTYLIQPELKHIGGVFEKSKDAKLNVWVTADDRRIVAKIRSKVVVGHFTGELTAFEGVKP
jgi:hypothetical protein